MSAGTGRSRYLHPNVGPAGDGKHIAYLQDPDEWRHLDAELFDTLMKLIGDRRSVADIQESGVLGDAVFAANRLLVAEIKVQDREHWRNRWFSRVKRQLAGCDLVFADPDNGLVSDDRFRPTRKENAKRIARNARLKGSLAALDLDDAASPLSRKRSE